MEIFFFPLTPSYGDKRQAFDFFLGMGEKDSCGDPEVLRFQAVSRSSWLLEGPGHSVWYGTLGNFQSHLWRRV